MLKLFIGVLSRMPFRVAWWFSWSIAYLWWFVIPIRKAVAVDGFSQAFPELPVGPNLRRSAAELVMGYIELFHEHRQPCVELSIEGVERIRKHLGRNEGIVLVAGHFGSWDLLGPMVCRQESLPATVVVRTQKWKPAATYVEALRRDFGMGLLPSRDSFERIMNELKTGRVLVFLLDQRYARGIPVPFFGRPAWTTPTISIVVQRSGAPIYGLDYWREGIGKHHARFSGPLPMTGDVEADTSTIQSFCEQSIRERPHAWLWFHDRWRVPRAQGLGADRRENRSA